MAIRCRKMLYVGTFTDGGKRFDAAEDPKHPFVFTLGRREVIQGWDQGLLEMCQGEKRILVIPSDLAYGRAGAGSDIPPDSSLTFHVEMLEILNRKYVNPDKFEITTIFKPNECSVKSQKSDRLSLLYVGRLKSTGVQFDAVKDPNNPIEFELGVGRVIKGWDEGLKDMCIGEKRRLQIPAEMAYGEDGSYSSKPPIPPDATLIFETELLYIKDRSQSGQREQENSGGNPSGWIKTWSVLEILMGLMEHMFLFL